MKPIAEIAQAYSFDPKNIVSYGPSMAKVSEKPTNQGKGHYIAVTAITPSPFGEGKTTTSIGLTQALGKLGHRAMVNLRQPSLGPIFGFKGGATGGGRSIVVPSDAINLHLTGDLHAVSAAHNLLSAAIDTELHHQPARLNIDPSTISWPRVLDINDRSLRQIITGLGGKGNGPVREAKFAITAASEIMGLLGLASDLADLRRRIGGNRHWIYPRQKASHR